MTDTSNFTLNKGLARDCHILGRFELCHVLLHRNASVNWFILVPETNVTDLFDLTPEEQQRAAQEVKRITDFLKNECSATKLNYGSIGNVVSQLHLHVVSRSEDDPCWPAPVWGNLKGSEEYASDTLTRMRQCLVTDYGLLS